jgi:hypothetical protein
MMDIISLHPVDLPVRQPWPDNLLSTEEGPRFTVVNDFVCIGLVCNHFPLLESTEKSFIILHCLAIILSF